MELQTDDRGNHYIETDRPLNEKTRVTYVPYQEWAGQAVIRVQVRAAGGNLRSGPEIPIDQVGDFVASIIDLLSKKAQDKKS
jgi:hypothetical protein